MDWLPLYGKCEQKDRPFKHLRRCLLSVALLFVAGFYGWVFYVATRIELPDTRKPIRLYSNQSSQDIKLLFCSALQRAQSSIYAQVYGITDPDLIHLFIQRSSQGIHTELAYDRKASASLPAKLPSNLTAYPVSCSGLMHRKILILDDTLSFLGSANLTTSSLRHHDNLIVGIFSPELTRWIHERSALVQKKKRGRKKGDPPPENPSFSADFGTEHLSVHFLPDLTKTLLPQLLSSLEQAHSSIQIAMFTLTHPLIADALVAAHKRGVQVQVAIDYYTARGASKKAAATLLQAGVTLYHSRGMQLLHHKWALIDEKLLITGSANWTKAAFDTNQDFLLFLSPLSPENQKFMQKLWKRIERASFRESS